MVTRRQADQLDAAGHSVAAKGALAVPPSAPAAVDEDGIHHEYEFGGPVGVTAMMIGFPALFYYLYACLFFYDGKFGDAF